MNMRISLLAGACLLAGFAAQAADAPTGRASAGTTATPTAIPALRPIEAEEAAPTQIPAKGANSFTDDQARQRIQDHGYTVVGNLLKDGNGVWHAEVTKGESKTTTMVALDFKGTLTEEQPYTSHPTTPLHIAPADKSGASQSGTTKPPIDGAP
jgi:hypothetical protein